MSDSFPIDEVVRRTGLTSRALRFYEARGLITPLRTGSGRRWFGPEELERIQRIVALKKAGLSLGDIKRLFDRKPIDLAALLGAQRQRLADAATLIPGTHTLVFASAVRRLDRVCCCLMVGTTASQHAVIVGGWEAHKVAWWRVLQA